MKLSPTGTNFAARDSWWFSYEYPNEPPVSVEFYGLIFRAFCLLQKEEKRQGGELVRRNEG